MIRLTVLTLAVLWLALPVPSAAEAMITRFIGVWVGEGVTVHFGGDTPEKIRCRMIGKPVSDSQTNLEGKCVTTSGSAKFRLMIAQDATGNIFAAKAQLSTIGELVSLAGTRDGDVLTLLAKMPIVINDKQISSRLQLVIPTNKSFELSNLLTDQASGEQTQSLLITLNRKR